MTDRPIVKTVKSLQVKFRGYVLDIQVPFQRMGGGWKWTTECNLTFDPIGDRGHFPGWFVFRIVILGMIFVGVSLYEEEDEYNK